MEKTTTKTAAACVGGGEDFMTEILVRLPIVSLLRFKCVCKSWRHLIQTSFFINLHTKQQLGGGHGGDTFILQAQHYEPSSYLMLSEILMLSSDQSGCGSVYGDRYWDIDGSLYKLYNLKLPSCGLCSKLSRGEVIAGSCNGLICLVSKKDRFMRQDTKHCVAAVSLWLWNPATRQFRILPKSLITISYKYFSYGVKISSKHAFHFVAFGFDVKTKDYKVVQITYLRRITTDDYSCQVQVYSLSTDSWRLLEGINSLPGIPNVKDSLYHYGGLYLNGSYFFVASAPKSLSSSSIDDDNHHCFIISFDFTKEIFHTIQFPPDHDDDDVVVEKKRWYLSCLGDKLALFTIRDYGYEDCDIWVLNENGGGDIKESWTKLHSFQIKRGEAKEWIIPRGILNNGRFALLETRNTDATNTKMQLYNLVTEEAKTDFPIWEEKVLTVLVYKPSLVSITGGRK